MGELDAKFRATAVWQVGALCRAIADALDARFNPVAVGGEIYGFTRAASGHCYFSLKDETGQMRCAMFRRAAISLGFQPRDGDRVEVRGRLGVYESRGELQLVVESMQIAGQGSLYEEFFKLKAKLELEGLFDASRKRILPSLPRGIGLVTSLGAAALHDVVTALQRRVPHIPVVLVPASVQGESAPKELVRALETLYAMHSRSLEHHGFKLDVILLVRGGGAMEDLWAFNSEQLVRTISASPVPIVSGVGHETDFTLADFVADLRAPTPTAAAEMVCESTQTGLDAIENLYARMQHAFGRHFDRQSQRLDLASSRAGRPSALANRQRIVLASLQQRMQQAVRATLQTKKLDIAKWQKDYPARVQDCCQIEINRLARAQLRLGLLDPSLVLKRGYAWLAQENGQTITSAEHIQSGQQVNATLADGVINMTVL